jgi:hypothetical protein
MSRPVRVRPYDGFAPGAVVRGPVPRDVAPSVGLPGAPVDTEVRVLDAARPDPRAPPTRPP